MLNLGLAIPISGGGLSATAQVIGMLAATGKKAFFPSTNPATGWWQDSTRVTQAALEQPVGWIDDTSQGLVLGAELATLSLLDKRAATDGTVTIAGGVLTFVSAAASLSTGVSQLLTLVVGRAYVVSATARRTAGTGALALHMRTASGGGGSAVSSLTFPTPGAWGTVTYTHIAASATEHVTLFAGTSTTIEVSAVSVKELPGYHATQANSLNRPLYTQRVNHFQRTEEFDNAAWSKTRSSISANSAVAPNGTTTADKLVEDSSTNTHLMTQAVTTEAGSYSFQVYAKAGERGFIRLADASVANAHAWFNLNTGAVGTVGAAATATISSSGSGWYLCKITFTATAASNVFSMSICQADALSSYTGDSASGIYIWGADLRLSAFAAMNLPAYQRVGNGTAGVADYDTAGFRDMLYFDGTSDALATSAIDLTGTDQIMALCNVLKVSDAAAGVCYETTANYASNNGAILIAAPASATASYSGGSRGTTAASATYTNAIVASPNLACLRVVSDISTPIVTLYRNGVSIATSSSSQGTGNYGNHALNIGARAGTGTWFKGYMIPGPLLDTTGIPAALLDQMAREQAALWGVAI
jgi:hypothetical protein